MSDSRVGGFCIKLVDSALCLPDDQMKFISGKCFEGIQFTEELTGDILFF